METAGPKVYVVTNVTSLLGKAIALGLAMTSATVLIVAKDQSHGAGVKRAISMASQNPNVELQLGDLSNLSSVRNLAEVINSKYEKIDGLINNNNIYRKQRSVTVDGFEEMFAANYLGPFLLTNLLLDHLRTAGSARILNLLTTPTTGQLSLDDLQSERRFNSIKAFNATRAANLLFTCELARRLENSGITVTALDPGLVRSEILNEAPFLYRLLAWLFAVRPEMAAEEIVAAVIDPALESSHGKFLHKGEEIKIPGYFLDQATQQRLWEISEKLTDANYLAPNYDPTGSVAMYHDKDIPVGLIRPEEDPTIEENGVVKRGQKS
jgi:NAD(P)-dependent dehydrogenase (short-subunit alcohol dehydrogenase family)